MQTKKINMIFREAMIQHTPTIISEFDEVPTALARIGLNKGTIVAVARAAAAARAEALPIDPISAPGWFAYAHGVRHMRLKLLPLGGWRLSRDGNVEAVVNDELGVQLCFQNVDVACDPNREPHAISRKGGAVRQQVVDGQGELFPLPQNDSDSRYGCSPAVWIICVEATEFSLKAEVSCPMSFEGSQFDGFHERIFVLDEDFDDLETVEKDDIPDLDDFDVPVSKKL